MNKEEIVIYVFATTNEMRECFKTYEHLFDKYSRINCYGILKNGLKIQFTNEIRGLRKIKTYDEIKIYLQEMNNQQENQSLKKENKILRENAEHNDKVVDKFNWENMLLKKENQELKKQLEEINKFKFSYRKDETKIPPIIRKQKDVEIIKNLKNQQKEFIDYMNKTIEELECDDVDDEEMKGYLIQRIDIFKEILSKFKKIIGSDINVGSKGGKDE